VIGSTGWAGSPLIDQLWVQSLAPLKKRSAVVLQFASCGALGAVGASIVVTIGLKYLLFVGGVYERPRAARRIHGPAFARQEVAWPRSAQT
jgi:hypothetical protein